MIGVNERLLRNDKRRFNAPQFNEITFRVVKVDTQVVILSLNKKQSLQLITKTDRSHDLINLMS